jgi:hypothetical protein
MLSQASNRRRETDQSQGINTLPNYARLNVPRQLANSEFDSGLSIFEEIRRRGRQLTAETVHGEITRAVSSRAPPPPPPPPAPPAREPIAERQAVPRARTTLFQLLTSRRPQNSRREQPTARQAPPSQAPQSQARPNQDPQALRSNFLEEIR